MHDQKIGTENHSTNEFFMEGLDGAGAQHRLGSGEIHQIIGVDDERAEAEFFAARGEGFGVRVWNTDRRALPHAWAGGKDLQRVAAELFGRFERVAMAAGNRSVNTDAEAAVHPQGRLRLRDRLRPVLVLRLKHRVLNQWKFCHVPCFPPPNFIVSVTLHSNTPAQSARSWQKGGGESASSYPTRRVTEEWAK